MVAVLLGLAARTAADPLPAAGPGLLGGDLAWSDSLDAPWPRISQWVYPIGHPLEWSAGSADGTPAFALSRGLKRGSRRTRRHDGADLSNRRAGDVVRSAATGLVAHADTTGATDYGLHAVLAHRLENGDIVATVYAHLQRGSLLARPGEVVEAGHAIGRVGATGRADRPHLHFEIRHIHHPTDSWLRARPVDPMAFVAARLPQPPDSTWSVTYLAWAERAGLIPSGLGPDAELTRSVWQRVLEWSGRGPRSPDSAAAGRRDRNPSGPPSGPGGIDPAGPMTWNELARDLTRLVMARGRMTPCPVKPDIHRERCRTQFDHRNPSRAPNRLASRSGTPTVAETCLVLADLTVRPARRR